MDLSAFAELEAAAARLHGGVRGARAALRARPGAQGGQEGGLEAAVNEALEALPALRQAAGGHAPLGPLLLPSEALCDDLDGAVAALEAHYAAEFGIRRAKPRQAAPRPPASPPAAAPPAHDKENGAPASPWNAPREAAASPGKPPHAQAAAAAAASPSPATPARPAARPAAAATPCRTPSLADFGLSAYVGSSAVPRRPAAAVPGTPSANLSLGIDLEAEMGEATPAPAARPPAASPAASPAAASPVAAPAPAAPASPAPHAAGPIAPLDAASIEGLPGYLTARVTVEQVNESVRCMNQWIAGAVAGGGDPHAHAFTARDVEEHAGFGSRSSALVLLLLKARPQRIRATTLPTGVAYVAVRHE